jgi:SAM-dependent methyltransferase
MSADPALNTVLNCMLCCSTGNAMGSRRQNMAAQEREIWRPVPCVRIGLIRRFFDLQTGSIWKDVAAAIVSAKGTLLDVGCGAQPYRRLLSPDVRYRAIDSADALEHFGYSAPDTTYYSGSRWPVDDAEIDTVLCTETLEHVLDPVKFLQEAWRCLCPGGQLILTVPFAARWHFIPHDYWRFTPSALRHLLELSRFEDIRVYARGNSLTVACYKNMAVVISLLMPQGRRDWKSLAGRVLGILLLPIFGTCALVGNLSLHSSCGDDCLGYTVLARRPSLGSAQAGTADQVRG